MTHITLVAAMAHDRIIGKGNQMPWHLPADLKHFKAITLHKPVIMGRHTFMSIGKALPDRRNIVVTRQPDFQAPGCEMAHSMDEAIRLAGDVEEVIIMGGAQIYQAALPLATHMYLTFIDLKVEGDASFPEWDPSRWNEITRENHPRDDKNPYAYAFVTLQRIQS